MSMTAAAHGAPTPTTAIPAPAAPHLRAVPPLPAPPLPAPGTTSLWWARLLRRGPGPTEYSLVAVNSGRFPDGTPVDMTAVDARGRRPAGWQVDVRYRAADGRGVRIEVAEELSDRCPPMWFAEVHHASSPVPCVSLLAFRGTAFRPGAVVRPHEVATAGVRITDRVAEVRWWTRSGLVDTVAVEPVYRGRGVARALVTAAEGLRFLRGWAPLRSDGRLTDAGAAWLATSPPAWRPRLTRRTEVLPDADVEEEPTGVTRLLR
jgi:GNAT superfamily N-acetyltransferase